MSFPGNFSEPVIGYRITLAGREVPARIDYSVPLGHVGYVKDKKITYLPRTDAPPADYDWALLNPNDGWLGKKT